MFRFMTGIVPIFVASSSAEDGSVSAKRHGGQGHPVRLSPVHRTVFCRGRRRPPVGSAASVGLRSGSIGRPAHGGTMRESLFLASETGTAESAAGIRPGDGFFISPRNATFTGRMPRRTLNRYAMSPKSFRVSRESPLLPFLLEACRSCSRTTVKSYLSHNQVEVNGRIVARFDHVLSPGDEVTVFPGRRVEPLRHPMLRIVYEDEWLIVGRQAERLAVGRYAARTDPYGLLYPERARQAERPGQPDIRRPPAGPRHVGPVGVRQKRAGPVAHAEDMERNGPSPHLRGRRGGRVRQEERNRIDLFGRKQGI